MASLSGKPEGRGAKGTGGGRELSAVVGVRRETGALSRRALDQRHVARRRHVRAGRRAQSGYRTGDVRGQVFARTRDTRLQPGHIRLQTASRKTRETWYGNIMNSSFRLFARRCIRFATTTPVVQLSTSICQNIRLT